MPRVTQRELLEAVRLLSDARAHLQHADTLAALVAKLLPSIRLMHRTHKCRCAACEDRPLLVRKAQDALDAYLGNAQ